MSLKFTLCFSVRAETGIKNIFKKFNFFNSSFGYSNTICLRISVEIFFQEIHRRIKPRDSKRNFTRELISLRVSPNCFSTNSFIFVSSPNSSRSCIQFVIHGFLYNFCIQGFLHTIAFRGFFQKYFFQKILSISSFFHEEHLK